jgi:DUF4097 and DUF4098 domain-containing protein YvlB
MPAFDTPEPISAVLHLVVGEARLTASDRADTIVEVRPSDATEEADQRAAEQTEVDFSRGQLTVRTPRPRGLTKFGKPGSVDVLIELPTGSELRGNSSVAAFRATGRLGDCRVKTSVGDIELDQAASLDLDTSAGGVAVERVTGSVTVSTSTGQIRLGEIDGTAVVKNSNGDCWIGAIGGDLRVTGANGSIAVDRAGASVAASTARGDVRIGALSRGSASLKTAFGTVEVGISAGTAARLDVSTQFGKVRTDLDAADSPEAADERVDVHARTSFGDILVRRA